MGGIVTGFLGSSPPSAPSVNVWQPQYTNSADTQAYNSISGINNNNPYLQNQPLYQGVLNSALNNPYAAGAQTAANTAGGQYATTGAQGAAGSTALNSGAMSLLPFISSVMNTASDPQSALYNQTKQNVTDQANVNNANYGITGPLAAGTTNQALTNFNMDWQNNQLQRLINGLSAAGSGISQAGTGLTSAANLGQNAAGSTVQSGQVPLTAYNTNLSNVQSALNNYGQSQVAGNQNTQTAAADLLNYLGLGAQQSNEQNQLQVQNYGNQIAATNAANNQLAGEVGGIGGLLGTVAGGIPLANNPNTSTSQWLNFFSGAFA